MHVEKTACHRGITIRYGPFMARETVHICANGCQQDGCSLRHRQPALAEALIPRSSIGYDVMVFVGIQRFLHHRQREEIRQALQTQHDVDLSSGEISILSRRFLVYLEALHKTRTTEIRQALRSDGGWPLHVDATGENGQGTLLVAYAGWRLWVLGAWKIPTERADAVLPRIRSVVECYGTPCSIMRDLGHAVIDAIDDLVGSCEQTIPVLGCHLHFLADIGKDLMAESHDHLRALFRGFEVQSNVRSLVRDLGRRSGTDIHKARLAVQAWLANPSADYRVPTGPDGVAVVRALAQWVLDYSQDGADEGFPFDLPFLDLYHRCRNVCRAVDRFRCAPVGDRLVGRALERLHRILNPVRNEMPFHRSVAILEARAELFKELRQTLRLKVKAPHNGPSARPSPQEDAAMLRDVRASVEQLEASLRQRRPERGPAQHVRQAIDLILAHLERHGASLWGHVITLPQSAGGGIRLVERTNVILESFFHGLKHGERRRSGRKTLTQDLEQLPAQAALAFNLTHTDYVAILCGTLEELPRAFAQLDAIDRRQALPVRTSATTKHADEGDVVSASMPRGDLALLRRNALGARVMAAANSRAPRH